MRWRFLSETSGPDLARRDELIGRIDRWWSAFQSRQPRLDAWFRDNAQWDLPGFMRDTLGAVHPELCWEFGPAVTGPGHRLVITPEVNRHLRPLVDTMMSRAPQLAGWEFYTHRVPEPFEKLADRVQARCGRRADDITFTAVLGDDGLVNVDFISPRANGDADAVEAEALVVAEALLGEEVLDHRIGVIEAKPPASWLGRMVRARGAGAALADLKPAVDGLIERHKAALPETRFPGGSRMARRSRC